MYILRKFIRCRCGCGLLGRFCGEAKKKPGSRQYSAGENLYDARKISKDLPANSVCLPFDGLSDIPTGVFRHTDGEVLGPQAGKCSYYRNPEYFAFHDMSFFDLAMCLNKYRQPQPDTGRKPL